MSSGERTASYPSRLESSVIAELEHGGNILVSRLSFLGDVVISTALIRKLHERFPNSTVDYLTRPDGAAVLEGEPGLGEIHCLPEASGGATWRLIRRMRRRRYAVSIDLFSNPRSALLTWLSGARMRIGGSRRGRRIFYTHPTRVPRDCRAATDHHLQYASPLGINGRATKPVLTISPEERTRVREVLKDAGVRDDAPVIGLHPGGKWEVKRWPAPYYGELAARLVERYGMQVVVFCGPGETPHTDALAAAAGRSSHQVRVLPTLPIRDTAAVIQSVDGVVVNDGGLMHVSVAVGTPTVGVFGSAEPDIWFPYDALGPFSAVYVPITCRPCHAHTCTHLSCMHKLTVDKVEDALLSVLREPVGEGHA